jgi:hypothetical protein
MIPVKVNSVDLEKAEDELRTRTKDLCKRVELTYWELGKALYEVYDGVPGGYRELLKGEGAKEARMALFKKWGYSSFEEYCEREVGLLRRSAQNIRYAYYWFQIELDLKPDVVQLLTSLGRSKVYLMAGFVQKDTVLSWIEKAQSMTYDELRKVIQAARATTKKSKKDEELFELAKGGAISAGDHSVPPAPETMHTVSTSLYDGQFNTWQQAVERAKSITNSDKISHNLEMICTDFLATNDFTDPEGDQKKIIAKYERLLGLKLIAIDPKSGKPVYGGDLLWKMVAERVNNDENAPNKTEKSGEKPELKIVREDSDIPSF